MAVGRFPKQAGEGRKKLSVEVRCRVGNLGSWTVDLACSARVRIPIEDDWIVGGLGTMTQAADRVDWIRMDL